MNAVLDEGVLLDYLNGLPQAARALEACTHRSISVVTWLEVMARSPAALIEPTRGFLRSFERLSISEAIADEALRLRLASPSLEQSRAIAWATANVNQLVFVTSRREGLEVAGEGGALARKVVMAYDGGR
jgi:hypothetical protein